MNIGKITMLILLMLFMIISVSAADISEDTDLNSADNECIMDNGIDNDIELQEVKTDKIKKEASSNYDVDDFERYWSIVRYDKHDDVTINLKCDIEPLSGTNYFKLNDSIKRLFINGNNNTVYGDWATTFMETHENSTVIIENLTITGCKGKGMYPAIVNRGNMTLNYCTLKDNQNDLSGGAILSYGNLVINNSILYDNHVKHSAGAIYSCDANLSIYNTIISNNTSNESAGAIYFKNNFNSSTLIIRDCMISNNTESYFSGAVDVNLANIYITNSTFYNNIGHRGALIARSATNLSITECIFDSNKGTKYEGAINTGGRLNIVNSTFKNNIGADVGAISSSKKTTINNTVFVNNTSYNNAGALSTWGEYTLINNSKFMDNTADNNGGAIHTSRIGRYILTNCEFTNNTARCGAVISFNEGNLTIDNSTICNNRAIEDGGVIYTDKERYQTANILLNSLNIKANTAGLNAGAIHTDNANLTIYNSKLTGNTASEMGEQYTPTKAT